LVSPRNTSDTEYVIEIKLVTAAIYTNFTTVIVDDDQIEQEDAYIAPPKGHKLLLEFRAIE
jgi:hypothetical protein